MSRLLLVSGMGRCGTSLVMGMLDAGGYPVECPPQCRGNSYEDTRVHGLIGEPHLDCVRWLEGATGRAVKLLDPHKFRLPESLRLSSRAIWLTRDLAEQAKSQWKFMRAMFPEYTGGRDKREAAQAIERSLRREQPEALAALPDDRLHLRFEDVLAHPTAAAVLLADFLGMKLDLDAMVARVQPRSPHCAPTLAMERFLVGGP